MGEPKILVVEDELDIAKVISINLKLEGMDVVEVHDGHSAVEKVDEIKPDCVVLDVMLPDLNGWQILEYIRSNPATADTPVVMVTARVEEHDQLRGLGAGAVKYITKPFSPHALTKAIKSVLKPLAHEEVERERRETIERLQLSAIHKISDILISASGLDELLKGVAGKLMSLFDLKGCAVILSNGAPEVYSFDYSGGQPVRGKHRNRGVVSRKTDKEMKQSFSLDHNPVRTGDINGFTLNKVFPNLDEISNGYIFPLFEQEEYLGSIVVPVEPDVTYSADEEGLFVTIANQVASAVARSRMHESLQEDEIIHRRLLHQTITAQESERRRLAADIHDGVVQSLVGVYFRLQAIEKKVPAGSNGGLSADLKTLEVQLSDNIKELRSLLQGLRPPMLDDMGLLAALQTHIKAFEQNNSVETELDLPGEIPPLTREAQINLFRIIQEALNNIEKHAEASHVDIAVQATPQSLLVKVHDDGKGFPANKKKEKPNHLGIANMKERTELVGGNLRIESKPKLGTSVIVDVPLDTILER